MASRHLREGPAKEYREGRINAAPAWTREVQGASKVEEPGKALSARCGWQGAEASAGAEMGGTAPGSHPWGLRIGTPVTAPQLGERAGLAAPLAAAGGGAGAGVQPQGDGGGPADGPTTIDSLTVSEASWFAGSRLEKAAPTPLELEVLEGPLAGTVIKTDHTERYQVGRTRSSKTFQIKDPSISEKHAEIVWRDGQWQLRDLGSSNGTSLNGEPLPAEGDYFTLKTGDAVQFGTDTVVRVTVHWVPDDSLTVEQCLQTECAQLEQQIKARAEMLARQLRQEWQSARQQLLAAGE